MKAGMEERGTHCAWEDRTNGWRKGGRDGRKESRETARGSDECYRKIRLMKRVKDKQER